MEANNCMKALTKMFDKFGKGTETKRIFLYAEHLAMYCHNPNILELSINECVKECEFLPAIATIIKKYEWLALGTEENKESKMWEEIKSAIFRIGSWGKEPEWSDYATQKTVQLLGGWIYLCTHLNDSNEDGFRRRAEVIYKNAQKEYNAYNTRKTAIGNTGLGGLVDGGLKKLN